jgi:hypothetical protein
MHGAATLIIDLDADGNFVWAWTVREKSENGRGAHWGNVLLLLRCNCSLAALRRGKGALHSLLSSLSR